MNTKLVFLIIFYLIGLIQSQKTFRNIAKIRNTPDLGQINSFEIKGEVTTQPGSFILNFRDIGFYLQNKNGGIYVGISNNSTGLSLINNINKGDIVIVKGSIVTLSFLAFLEVIPTQIILVRSNRNNIEPLIANNFIDFIQNELGILYEIELKANVITPIPTGTGARVDTTDIDGNFIRLFYTNFTEENGNVPFEIGKIYKVRGIKRYFIDICLILSNEVPAQNVQLSPRGSDDVIEISEFTNKVGYKGINFRRLNKQQTYPFLKVLDNIKDIRSFPDITLLTGNTVITGELTSNPGELNPGRVGNIVNAELLGFFIQNKNNGIFISIKREQFNATLDLNIKRGDMIRVTNNEVTLNARSYLQINTANIVKLLSNVNRIKPKILNNFNEYKTSNLGILVTTPPILIVRIGFSGSFPVALIQGLDCVGNRIDIFYTNPNGLIGVSPYINGSYFVTTGIKTYFRNLCFSVGSVNQRPRLRPRNDDDIQQVSNPCN